MAKKDFNTKKVSIVNVSRMKSTGRFDRQKCLTIESICKFDEQD